MKFIALGIILFPFFASGQNSCDIVIDSAKILGNENLEHFLRSLKTDKFQSYQTKDSIPFFIRTHLSNLTNGFSIANPNEPYQCCCTSSDSLPQRQLGFLAKSKDALIMTYKTGGMGISLHLLMIRFANEEIVDLWSGYCWTDVKNINDIVHFIEESKKKQVPGRRRPSIQVGVVVL